MLLALAPITIPLIVAGVVVGAIIYRMTKPKKPTAAAPGGYDPDQTGGKAVPPAPPSGPPTEPAGEPFQQNPNELAITSQLVDAIVATPGATLAEKMATCTFPVLDGLRVAAGGSAVNRCWRDQNKAQSEVGWISNMGFWSAYPRGPEKLKYPNSLYAAAWGRINNTVKSKLATAGLLPGA